MDTAAVLDKYTQDLLNLPLEIKHLFEELKTKDLQLAEARRRYQTKDSQLHKFIRANGTLTRHPKELQICQKIEEDMRLVQKIQKEKMLLANTALFLVSKHMCNFEADIQKLERDELIAPVDESAAHGENHYKSPRSSPAPVPKKKRPASVMKQRKRPKSEDADDGFADESGSRAQSVGASIAKAPSAEDADNNLYCFCQRVSFGEMIGCDNDDCKYEWFHWECVGITSPPNDDEIWYCPDCAPKMEKRKKRKK
ncbi:chromatin modification-related protein YNG2 [Metschnikowia aff. pulcherrima]|uniref:Chromatin modification-related protein n=1 Tax=Metschnikowia aff. pulcherrima TaxID=2163413 RepID=A0A4P6XMJ1_9ASCO|nr:chromatin modification-related protein YNG2 [Metschnikowia aff. pulcherrima]